MSATYLKALKTVAVVCLILLSSFQVACTENSKNKTVSVEEPVISEDKPVISEDMFRIKRLPHAQTITLGDHSLAEWDSSFIVMKVPSQQAFQLQWKTIKGHAPDPLSQNDIDLTVYMARDNDYWYVALEAMDDSVLASPAPHPYGGDCLEVFFAGKALDAPMDMHRHVATPSSRDQAAFLQLVLPAAPLDAPDHYFPGHRTDSTFIRNATRFGFMTSIWRTASGWSAEARIPFAAFEPEVLSRINGHQPLKMNIDYPDYDESLAPAIGYKPDNVFCLDDDEKHVNVPGFMRSVTFE